MAKYTLAGYETPKGINNATSVKTMQQKLGVTADGIWGPKTQAAFDKMHQPSAGSSAGIFNTTTRSTQRAVKQEETADATLSRKAMGRTVFSEEEIKHIQQILGAKASIGTPAFQQAYLEYAQASIKEWQERGKHLHDSATIRPVDKQAGIVPVKIKGPVLKSLPWKIDKEVNMPMIPASDPVAGVRSITQPTVFNYYKDNKGWGDSVYFTPYYRSNEREKKAIM